MKYTPPPVFPETIRPSDVYSGGAVLARVKQIMKNAQVINFRPPESGDLFINEHGESQLATFDFGCPWFILEPMSEFEGQFDAVWE